MTFTIIATSKKDEQIGLGTASCGLFTGTICPIVWPSGVFIGTSQAYVNRTIKQEIHKHTNYGTLTGIEEELKSHDPYFEYRQIAIIGMNGQKFAHTGKETTGWSGHIVGDDYIITGNMLKSSDCLERMKEEFEKDTELPLAERLMRALEACRVGGGQFREGRDLKERAAALVVVKSHEHDVDIRVDMDEDAVLKLRQFWDTYKVYKTFMMECEEKPESLTNIHDQEKMMPLAPSIFAGEE